MKRFILQYIANRPQLVASSSLIVGGRSSLRNCRSSLVAHHSLLTAHHSTICAGVTCRSLIVARYLPLTRSCALLVTRCSLLLGECTFLSIRVLYPQSIFSYNYVNVIALFIFLLDCMFLLQNIHINKRSLHVRSLMTIRP